MYNEANKEHLMNKEINFFLSISSLIVLINRNNKTITVPYNGIIAK